MKVNYEELEQKYGAELVDVLKKDIAHAEHMGWEWKVEVISSDEFITTIALVSRFDVYLYDIYGGERKALRRQVISYWIAKKSLQLMNEMREKK